MSGKGRQIRGVLALCGVAVLLAALGKMPATLSAYSAIERGEGPAVVAASYNLAAETTMPGQARERAVTVTVDELVGGTTSDGTPTGYAVDRAVYSDEMITAAMAEVTPRSATVSCETVELTLTVGGDTTGYLAMRYADGLTYYYSGVLEPEHRVTLTLPAGSYAEQTERDDRVSVYIATENGLQLLTVEACWGTPPDTANPVSTINTVSEENGTAVNAAGSIEDLQKQLDDVIDGQLRTLETTKRAELLAEMQQELQAALERQRLAAKQAEQERLEQEANQAAAAEQEGAEAGTDNGTGEAQENGAFGLTGEG